MNNEKFVVGQYIELVTQGGARHTGNVVNVSGDSVTVRIDDNGFSWYAYYSVADLQAAVNRARVKA